MWVFYEESREIYYDITFLSILQLAPPIAQPMSPPTFTPYSPILSPHLFTVDIMNKISLTNKFHNIF